MPIIVFKCFTTESESTPNKFDVPTWESVNTGVGPFSLNQVFPTNKTGLRLSVRDKLVQPKWFFPICKSVSPPIKLRLSNPLVTFKSVGESYFRSATEEYLSAHQKIFVCSPENICLLTGEYLSAHLTRAPSPACPAHFCFCSQISPGQKDG